MTTNITLAMEVKEAHNVNFHVKPLVCIHISVLRKTQNRPFATVGHMTDNF